MTRNQIRRRRIWLTTTVVTLGIIGLALVAVVV